MTNSQLQINLFGEFSLIYRGNPTPVFNADRPISLLAYLLLHRDTAVSRQHLAFTLWPDSSDSQARANLRNLFYTLRQSLPQADTYLAADSMTMQWCSDANFSLDVADFEAALSAAKTAASDADKLHWLETAVSYYKGDLLPGKYEDWIIPQREALRQAYQDALYQLVPLLERAENFRMAARYGQLLVQHDPLDETAYVQLMRLHALSGDRAGVRRVYEQCATALSRELNVEPGPATQAAYEQLMRLKTPAALLSEPESLPAPREIRPSPLPIPATPFIGREAELAHLAELLANPSCRLLTIVGPGGIGKTRLALQTAVGHQPVLADGVIWVSLNDLQTPEQLAGAIAEALHYRLSGKVNPEVELLHALAAKQLLLALDNFEHLLPATELLTQIVAQTTAVKLLVTSRVALDLQEEWRFDLDALPIPDQKLAAALADNSAVRLFVQSARRANSKWTVSEADYPAIAHICQLTGGMPLGIELAASWMRLLSCAEIAQEIEKNLDFLTVNLRNIPFRHRSLRAVFEYSWNLLTPDEQQRLMRLSIFEGGFTRAAAAQVADADLPQLSLLVDHSLVQRTAVGRYNLHNIIRQFAHEHLQADPAASLETADRHGRYYLQWLVEQNVLLRGPKQKEGLTAVAADLANLRLAIQWALAHRQTGLLRQAAFPMFYFYELRGLLSEGEASFQLAVASLQNEADSANHETQAVISALQTYQAYLGFRQGKMAAAEILLRQAKAQLQSLADDTLLSHCLCYLGLVEWSLGRFPEAVDCLQTSLECAIRQEDQWEMATAQVYLGMIRHDQGELTAARQQLTAVQPTVKMLGDPRLIANSLLISGRINLLLGYLAEAEQQLVDCLEITQYTQDPNSVPYATLYLGAVKQAQGDLTAARQFIQQSMRLYAEFNDLVGLERASVTLGFLELETGNLEAAKSHFLAFLCNQQRTHAVRYVLAAVVGLAALQAHAGNKSMALAWVFAVLQNPALDWEAKQRSETLRAQLESDLSPEQITMAQEWAANQPFSAVLADVIGH